MLKNFWYIATRQNCLKATEPLGMKLLGENIVLFRNEEGKASALLDRCCHRGFPLSKSPVCNGRIRCGFHGWEFDTNGRCAFIPSQTPEKRIPESFQVPQFPCVEQDSYIWVWMGDKKPCPVPSLPETRSGKWVQGVYEVNCNYLTAMETTYDSSHVYFVHPTHPATIGMNHSGLVPRQIELRATDMGCISFAPTTQSEEEAISEGAVTVEFRLPGFFRTQGRYDGKPFAMLHHVVPLTEKKTRVEWMVTAITPSRDGIVFCEKPTNIGIEDTYALEAIQKAYDEHGDDFERSVEGDTEALLLRKIVNLAESGKWNGKTSLTPRRRIVNIMAPASYLPEKVPPQVDLSSDLREAVSREERISPDLGVSQNARELSA